MASLYNRVRMSTATTGTGTITLGAATSNSYFTFAEAGVTDGATVSYVIEDGLDVEFGVGTYTSSGTTLSRDTVTASKINGTAGTSKITLSGSAVVFITALAADITVPPASSTDNAIARYNGTSGRSIQNSSVTVDDPGQLSVGGAAPSGLTGAENIWLLVQNPNHNPGGGLLVGDYDSGGGGTNRNTYATLDNFNNDGYGEGFSAQYARGTRSSKAIVQANDTIAGHVWYGYDGNSYVAAASFYGAVDGTPGDGDMPGRIGFAVTGDGEASPTDAMNIISNRSVGIGTSINVDRRFHVEQDGATTNAAVPVARFTVTTSGTAAAGLGPQIELETENASGTNRIAGSVEAVYTDASDASEDADVVFRAIVGGSAGTEVGRASAINMHTIASGSLPAATTQPITGIPARYSRLVLHVAGASSGTATRMPWVRFSTNNGSSYDSTSGNYPGQKVTGTTWTAITAASATAIESATATAAQTFTFTLYIEGYAGGAHPRYHFRCVSNTTEYQGSGTYIGSTSAINAIQILWNDTGNFDAGTYALYGVY